VASDFRLGPLLWPNRPYAVTQDPTWPDATFQDGDFSFLIGSQRIYC